MMKVFDQSVGTIQNFVLIDKETYSKIINYFMLSNVCL